MPRRCDIWRIGVVRAPIRAIHAARSAASFETVWLPEEPASTFLADPFGLWRQGVLHVFAEQYDYRDRHGVIVCLRFDASLRPIDRRLVLREPWHLSYPFVFEAEGETWLLPEAFRSGALTLYRATDFPHRWMAAGRIDVPEGAVDATPFRHEGRWWLAYAAAGSALLRQSTLCLAYADRLIGPWTPHPLNPVRVDRAGARPGGTPFVTNGGLILPVQDCTTTYGRAVRPLSLVRLDPEAVQTMLGAPLTPPLGAGRYGDGFHTLAGCGDVSLVDVKRIDRSGRGWLLDLRRLVLGSGR